MKNVLIKVLTLMSLYLLFSTSVNAERIRNMYILVEPDEELRSSVVMIEQLIKERKRFGVTRVFWRAANDELAGIEDKMNYLSKGGGKGISKKKIARYLRYYEKTPINSGEALGKLASHFKNFNWKADQTLLVILGDLVYKTKFITSRHASLNDAFINAADSPFRKHFLNKVTENETLYGLRVVVFNRQNPSLETYTNQNRFINILFEQLNQNVRVCGAFYPMNYASLHALKISSDMIKSISGGYCPVANFTPLNSRVQLPQIVKDDEEIRVVF